MLSIIIITKNEARHICQCLQSVAFADEIIVLDSGSTDATVSLCLQYTDKVFSTDWPGFGIQKQRALEKARGDWILSIDADETVSPALQKAIQQAMQSTTCHGYAIPRLSNYCGRTMRHSGWWPDYVLRLFRREQGAFSESIVHERIVVNGPVEYLQTPLLHDAFVDANEVLNKINSYSSLSATMLYENGRRGSLSKAIAKGLWAFFRSYIIKAGFLDGPQGLMLAISNAEGSYYKQVKLIEMQKRNGVKS